MKYDILLPKTTQKIISYRISITRGGTVERLSNIAEGEYLRRIAIKKRWDSKSSIGNCDFSNCTLIIFEKKKKKNGKCFATAMILFRCAISYTFLATSNRITFALFVEEDGRRRREINYGKM